MKPNFTTLFCLLSEQMVPNLLSVHHFRPDWLVLLESADMRGKRSAERLLKALQIGGLDYREHCFVAPLEEEQNLESVRKSLQWAYEQRPEDEWLANITGGTKLMSLAAYEFFRGRGARLIYIDASKPTVLLDLGGRPSESCDHRLTIKEFLASYGFEQHKSDRNVAEAEERARRWWSCAREIARDNLATGLLKLNDKDRNKARRKGIELTGQCLTGLKPGLRASIAETFHLDDKGGGLHGRLDKYGAQFLTGGWLEVFFWGLLDRHAESMGIWDVRLGLEIGPAGLEASNDLDVAFMHNHTLCTVECKTGAQEHDAGADGLYKIEAIIRQTRALRVRSYLATTSGNVLDKDGSLKPGVKARANLYNCRILTRDKIQQLAVSDEPASLLAELLGFRG